MQAHELHVRFIRVGVLPAVLFVGCGRSAQLPVEKGMGPAPELPAPSASLIPTIKVAKAVRWTSGMTPKAGDGLAVAAFATGLDHPRWLHVLPNGDVLVAEPTLPGGRSTDRAFAAGSSRSSRKKLAARYRARTGSRCSAMRMVMAWRR